jgi:hypothetical protein
VLPRDHPDLAFALPLGADAQQVQVVPVQGLTLRREEEKKESEGRKVMQVGSLVSKDAVDLSLTGGGCCTAAPAQHQLSPASPG